MKQKTVDIDRLMHRLLQQNPDMDADTFSDAIKQTVRSDPVLGEAIIGHMFERVCELADRRARREMLTDEESDFLEFNIRFWQREYELYGDADTGAVLQRFMGKTAGGAS